jgi:uncharacterized protein YcbX
MVRITALNVYPVKGCRGIALDSARVTPSGFEHDREWLIVRGDGRFMTQREEPRLALIGTAIGDGALRLQSDGSGSLEVPLQAEGAPVEVTCWRDRCAAFDVGDEAAQWLSDYLRQPARLVRFDPRRKRPADTGWTKGVEALNRFTDAFPWLLISQASLDDLNARLEQPLPMNRFRPNIVVDGLPAYGEDHVYEFVAGSVRLRPVKPCARCVVTTTNQLTGERDGEEPLRTLKQYRFNRAVMGVAFGQNLILGDSAQAANSPWLTVGQEFGVDYVVDTPHSP